MMNSFKERHQTAETEKPASEQILDRLPAEFIAGGVLAFVASVSATVYFCRSMCCLSAWRQSSRALQSSRKGCPSK